MAHTSWDGGSTSPNGPAASTADDASLGELLKRLSHDTGELIQQEIALARAEAAAIAENVRAAVSAFAIAAAVALVGLLTLAAFAVIAIGNALDGRYWLSALLVGAAALLVSVILVKRAASKLAGGRVKPTATVQSLRADARWAAQQTRELKQDLTSTTHSNGG